MNILIKQIKSNLLDSGSFTSHFLISNLSTGLGLTLGNSLRRILLSQLTGTSIIAVKIPGIFSEFSSIFGLREDTLEFILNLKQVILRNTSFCLEYGKIEIQGPGVLIAKSITFSSDVTIINPNQYLATVYTNHFVRFEVIAQKRSGYTFTKYPILSFPLFLNINAIFIPVLSVNYSIKEQQLDSLSCSESLLLEITTNGSLSPNSALRDSSKLLITFFQSILYFSQSQTVR